MPKTEFSNIFHTDFENITNTMDEPFPDGVDVSFNVDSGNVQMHMVTNTVPDEWRHYYQLRYYFTTDGIDSELFDSGPQLFELSAAQNYIIETHPSGDRVTGYIRFGTDPTQMGLAGG